VTEAHAAGKEALRAGWLMCACACSPCALACMLLHLPGLVHHQHHHQQQQQKQQHVSPQQAQDHAVQNMLLFLITGGCRRCNLLCALKYIQSLMTRKRHYTAAAALSVRQCQHLESTVAAATAPVIIVISPAGGSSLAAGAASGSGIASAKLPSAQPHPFQCAQHKQPGAQQHLCAAASASGAVAAPYTMALPQPQLAADGSGTCMHAPDSAAASGSGLVAGVASSSRLTLVQQLPLLRPQHNQPGTTRTICLGDADWPAAHFSCSISQSS